MKISKSITLEEEIWDKIDELRIDINRSRFIEKILIDKLKVNIYKG